MFPFRKKTAVDFVSQIVRLAKRAYEEIPEFRRTGKTRRARKLLEAIAWFNKEEFGLIRDDTGSEELVKKCVEISKLAEVALKDLDDFKKFGHVEQVVRKILELEKDAAYVIGVQNEKRRKLTKWFYGVSVKDPQFLKEYYDKFGLLEVDLNKVKGFSRQGLLDYLRPFRSKIYSFHLREGGSIQDALEDFEFVASFGVKMVVTHTFYPKSRDELKQQLKVFGDRAKVLRVHVSIENLCDRKRKAGEYEGSRDPNVICSVIQELGNPWLGLCLDTSHAIYNQVLKWCTPQTLRRVKHVHLSDNLPDDEDADKHLPLTDQTDKALLIELNTLLQNNFYKGVIILENKKLADSELSDLFLQKRRMAA